MSGPTGRELFNAFTTVCQGVFPTAATLIAGFGVFKAFDEVAENLPSQPQRRDSTESISTSPKTPPPSPTRPTVTKYTGFLNSKNPGPMNTSPRNRGLGE